MRDQEGHVGRRTEGEQGKQYLDRRNHYGDRVKPPLREIPRNPPE